MKDSLCKKIIFIEDIVILSYLLQIDANYYTNSNRQRPVFIKAMILNDQSKRPNYIFDNYLLSFCYFILTLHSAEKKVNSDNENDG